MTLKAPSKDIKLLFAITAALIALIVLTLTVFNPPQCQDQVDISGCIVGANIGLPFLTIFVILPLSFFVMALWILALDRAIRKRPKKTTKKPKK